jgi:hypothetical protein
MATKKRKRLAVLSGLTPHLTGARPIDTLAEATYPGQAHWAGTGPRGRTCRECMLWNVGDGRGDYADFGGIKPRRCAKFQILTMRRGQPIPHYAPACRHFEINPDPPHKFVRPEPEAPEEQEVNP